MSLTGLRGIMMLGLLIQAPRTLEEIREKFIQEKLMEEDNSNDIIRIDMNTLRSMGCEISRSSANTGYKYVLTKNPYGLNITIDEVNLLKRAYRCIMEGAKISTLLEYDDLFRKFADCVFDTNIKEQLYGISALRHLKKELLKQLIDDCEHHNTLEIAYKDISSYKQIKRRLVAEKIEMRNDKIYLLGYDLDKKENTMLPVKRISKIISRITNDTHFIEYKPLEVKFILKNFNAAGIEDGEEIIKTNEDYSFIMKGNYHNEFMAIQRILSFGADCTVIEPEDIKQKVINKLLEMREIYKND